jgi:hypothetical protein
MKKRLHPYLAPHPGPGINDRGNEKYHGGHFNLFGLELDVSWDEKEESWMVSGTCIMNDEEMSSSLEGLVKALPLETVAMVFGDEKEVTLSEVLIEGNDKFFWDDSGARWMIGTETGANNGSHLGSTICVRIVGLTDLPSGEVRLFKNSTLVYVYPKERNKICLK